MEWDLYDNKFQLTDKTIQEELADEIPDGLYHLTVNVWVINSQKQVLLLKKVLNFNFRYPGFWTSINGNVKKGHYSIDCVKDILKEKLGLIIDESEIIELGKDIRDPHHYIYNTFVVYKDINLNQITLDENYFSKMKWVDFIELENMINNGEIETALTSRIDKYIKNILKNNVSKN